MNKKQMNGFTLVELLAVIVILAIILVIAVPKVMNVISESKKATIESTAKMIAGTAEKKKVQNTILGNVEKIDCEDVAKINDVDYESCSIEFVGNTAKVTLVGSGKFEGLNVCNGSKTNAVAKNRSCPSKAVKFEDDDWVTIVAAVKSGNHPYQVGNEKAIDLGSLGVHTIRIANITACDGSLDSETACGFVLEFKDIINKAQMNDKETTNVGGWPASTLRTYVNNTIYNAIPEDLREGIIDTKVVTEYEGDIDKLLTSTDKLYLLSRQELVGDSLYDENDSLNEISRQLDYYAINKVSITNYEKLIKGLKNAEYWWLRSTSPLFNDAFYSVSSFGYFWDDSAAMLNGVSPAFRLAN